MKFIIASDIHGSAYYCRKLLEVSEKENADRIILLGDILYHGPRNDLPKEYDPKQVAEMLNSISDKVLYVRGNCDTEVDKMVLNNCAMSDCMIIPLENRVIYATHGHVYNKDNLPLVKKGDIILYGHTHVPENTEKNGVFAVNPGSVSIPKEGSSCGYILMEKGRLIRKGLDGSIDFELDVS